MRGTQRPHALDQRAGYARVTADNVPAARGCRDLLRALGVTVDNNLEPSRFQFIDQAVENDVVRYERFAPHPIDLLPHCLTWIVESLQMFDKFVREWLAYGCPKVVVVRLVDPAA